MVHVAGQVFMPGDVPPADVAALIRNPHAWEVTDEPDVAADGAVDPALGGGPAAGGAGQPGDRGGTDDPGEDPDQDEDPDDPAQDHEQDDAQQQQDQTADVVGEPPPRAGRGSSATAWQRFADANGVQVAEGASQRDIIAACEQAGVIPPQ